ncbi:MAG: SRPBCC family protein [Woeseiaceae bacterium]
MRLIIAALALLSLPVSAAELLEITVDDEDGRYIMTTVTEFDAPRLGVFDVLTDYERFGRISSVYDDAGFAEPSADGIPRVFTRVKGCVLFFCQTMDRTERLENDGLDRIRATVEPGSSDFEYSVATWLLSESDEGGTRVIYTVEMVPSFWVPPVIGPYVMKRKLRKGGRDAIERIEALAFASTADLAVLRSRGLSGFD